MRSVKCNETIISADERRRFNEGDHYRFHVDEVGALVFSVAWDEGFSRYVDNTSTVLADREFVKRLQYYFLDHYVNIDRRPDPMDLAREYAVDGHDDGGGAA